MKTAFVLFVSFLTLSLSAQQISKVSLQASGLTCSMCSNSINKSLKTIHFVETVVPNVQTSTFEITFRQGTAVDFDLLKKKVEDAGFFVSSFVANVNFGNIQVSPNQPVTVGDKTFQFINAKGGELAGEKPIRILNKGFVSAKEYKKNAVAATGTKIYYATI